VSLASRGLRKLGDSEEQIEDEAELKQVRKQARVVLIKSVLAAFVMTLLILLIP
jgi:hypothetical protein